MPSKFLNISTDTTLGGSSASDSTVSSQKAIKAYVDSQIGTAPAFANITGQPTDNTNLASALNAKYDASNPNGYTSNIGTVTSVNNTSPDSGGNVSLTIPTVNNATLTITQGGTTKGTFTANASSDVTIALDAGGASILEALYPVGSVYITTANTCPLSTLISGSTWELVSSGRVLQGADSGHSAGTTIAAGLPNIEGTLYFQIDYGQSLGVISPSQSGLFNAAGDYNTRFTQPVGGGGKYSAANFNASRANSIYGNSSTVQPPAYCVNIWKRTA